MVTYIIFLIVVLILYGISYFTKTKGLNSVEISREIDKKVVTSGEVFKMKIVIENNKKLPVFFLNISEVVPLELKESKGAHIVYQSNFANIINNFSISSYERVKKTFKLHIDRRGVYRFKKMQISVGDIFGFSTEDHEVYSSKEIVVAPYIRELDNLKINGTSIQGDNIIRRWMYKDYLYIKGIREYSAGDRMKDVNWKYSARLGNLMVKEYDYTHDTNIIIILDMDKYIVNSDFQGAEEAIELAASLSNASIAQGIPVGMWTNAHIVGYHIDSNNDTIEPSLNSLNSILELCGRADVRSRINFYEYLNHKINILDRNTTYIIVTSCLDLESINLLKRAQHSGYMFKIVDASKDNSVDYIAGIEKYSIVRRNKDED
ncbi:DUF58 domain-containing protein [Clostridium sp. 19966]|uniref:DUF58 domain-containing protein n=1 Tax=Clostridium sp. 19966 TaxID=2768166 RepID=UPI0028DF40E9|nr:DUF58 domain-containing protein [Clostridium sp. 19966]MDT8717443.1 DUF58 domain-containing protein [Clostridium sp. 19966]